MQTQTAPFDFKGTLWILGLNHSGTTIFWRSFRKDQRFLCFDEPFTPDLGVVFPRDNYKGTFGEYLKIYSESPNLFWDRFAPIWPSDELIEGLTERQKGWLDELNNKAGFKIIDETNLHMKLSHLLQPDAYVVHLHRRARGFVTSHLVPSVPKGQHSARSFLQRLRRWNNQRIFWDRTHFPGGALRANVIGADERSHFGLILAEAGYDAERIMRSPLVVRYLAYWHFHFKLMEREGPHLFGKRYLSVNYDAFAKNPRRVMEDVYGLLGITPPEEISYFDVKHPKPAHDENSTKWREAAKVAGFSDDDIIQLL